MRVLLDELSVGNQTENTMDIWETNKLILFLQFFVPGFIAIKVYDLFVPGEQRDAKQTVLDATAYSCINYAALSWLIYIDFHRNLSGQNPFLHGIILILVLLLFPVVIAVGYFKLRTTRFFGKYTVHPVKKPWDYVFGKRESYWVIIALTDGTQIGGMYDTDSFASSFPAEEQIYLERVWEVEGQQFINPVHRSKGVIISGKNINWIQFFQ
jgi:hypothetical protein